MSRFPLSLCLHSARTTRWRDQLIVDTGEGRKGYQIRRIAPWLRAEVGRIYQASDILKPPSVVLTESVPDLVAFATPGLIVLGHREITELANQVCREQFSPVDPYTLARGEPGPVVSVEDIYYGTWRFVIAHEMGHIVQFAEDAPGSRLELEMDADHFAGRIAELLGWNPAIDQAVARTVGCDEHHCRWAYQSPHGRSKTYAEGRRFQARADRPRPPRW